MILENKNSFIRTLLDSDLRRKTSVVKRKDADK
jgi:hypothetical protein